MQELLEGDTDRTYKQTYDMVDSSLTLYPMTPAPRGELKTFESSLTNWVASLHFLN